MYRTLFLLTVLCANLFTVSAQTDEAEGPLLLLPDTFELYKPTDIKYVTTLDSVEGKIFDSISNPKAYFISSNGYAWVIAVKQKKGYAVFDPFAISSAYTDTSSLKFSREDVNGKGSKELVIKWEFYAGHSGWVNSMHERSGGIQIWDLDRITRLMDFQNYYSYQNWWTAYAEDPTDTLDYDKREVIDSGSRYRCESYSVKFFDKKQITIWQENNCRDQDELNKYTVKDKTIYTYVLTGKGLVRDFMQEEIRE